jgi:hypothetical protein
MMGSLSHLHVLERKQMMGLLSTEKTSWVSIRLMLEVPHCVHLIVLVVFEDTCKNLLGVFASFDPMNL